MRKLNNQKLIRIKNLFALLLIMKPVYLLSQQSIYATIYGGDLYSIEIEDCTRRFVGSTEHIFGDIAFTPDGRLWGIEFGDIYQIDTVSAAATLVGSSGLSAVSLVALNDTILLAESGKKLYGINTEDAFAYYIDTIGFSASGDLTWYDNDLYMTSGDKLIKMVLNATTTAISSVVIVNSDDVPIPVCEAAATAYFTDDYNSILGFNGPDLYKICQLDGTSILLCPMVNEGGTSGAASFRLPVQIPEPVTCKLIETGILSENNYIYVSPNPCIDYINISSDHFSIDNASMLIKNSFGETILYKPEMNMHSSKMSAIDISNFAKGIYFIIIDVDGQRIIKSIVKE